MDPKKQTARATNRRLEFIIASVMGLSLWGCQDPKTTAPQRSSAAAQNNAALVDAPLQNATELKNKVPQKIWVDPTTLKASVQKQIKLVPSGMLTDPSWTFPQIEIDLKNSEYVKILRCNRNYDIRTVDGTLVDSQNALQLESSELKWAWSQAESDNRNCKIVSGYVPSATYTDLASPSGDYYYVINPCLSEKSTESKLEECSYRLDMSEAFSFQSHFKEDLRAKAMQLTKIQSSLDAKINRLRMLAEELKIAIRYCERFYASQEAMKAVQRGTVMAGLFVGAFAAGSLIGSPNTGVMAGQMAMMMGGQMLNAKLGLTQTENTCLGATKQYERYPTPKDPAEKKALSDAIAAAQALEAKFGVQGTFDKIEALTTPQTGEIARDMAAMQNMMAEMSVMDQRVVTADAWIAKGSEMADKQIQQAGPALPTNINSILGEP
jgi:hypothetical protein